MSAVTNTAIAHAIAHAIDTLAGLAAWDATTAPPPGRCTIEVLYSGGDLTVTFDPKEETQAARMQSGFDQLTALGYTALVVAPPERAGQTAVLDKEAEAIVFVPQICGG